MTQRLLVFYSSENLCIEDYPVDAVIQVPYEKVAPKECIESEEEQDFQYSTISGQIVSKECTGCGTLRSYKYTFQYDDEQVIPNYTLQGGDVLGFATKTAVDIYLEEKIGNDVYVYTNELGETYLVNQHGCEYLISTGDS